MKDWEWHAHDEELAQQLQARLPKRLFDAHVHAYCLSEKTGSPMLDDGPQEADLDAWRVSMDRQFGQGRVSGGLFFPMPGTAGATDEGNRFLLAELDTHPESRGLLLVTPQSSREQVEAWLEHPSVIGFKVYHLYADRDDTFEAEMEEYLPEWLWEAADRQGLIIMLHMVRQRAMRDPDNQREIRDHCERYPGAKLILAHAARGFHAEDTVQGLSSLKGLDNVWFDSSGICEDRAFRTILEQFGPRRLMWASDYPISEKRGKCVTVGDSFCWINPERIDSHAKAPAMKTYPVGLEGLQALFMALDDFGASEEDMQDVFCDNTLRLVGMKPLDNGVGQELYEHAKQRIPGGTHLLSKRPEMFAPDQWPAYFRECRGCEVWDMDGKHYVDMSINGIGTSLLGYGDPDVQRAVRRRLSMGVMGTLNSPEEVELADRLCEIHPWADCVRLARTGGEIAAVAVRIARATTERPVVAICGYHGWADWYLAANLGDNESLRGHLLPGLDPDGVPGELRGTVEPFTYNNREELAAIIATHGDRLAAVVMEPCRAVDPEPGFLEYVRAVTRANGTLLIFDEITIGWRRCFGGAHLRFGVEPDMALFAKALGSGHPIAAVIGSAEAMEGARTSFISSAYWTESIGPAAALATLRKMEEANVVEHVDRIGTYIQKQLRQAVETHGLPVRVSGYTCAPMFTFEHEDALALKTLYTQEMLAEGYLASPMIYVTLAHTEQIVDDFAEALDRVFGTIAEALKQDDVQGRLKGPVAHGGFKRLIT